LDVDSFQEWPNIYEREKEKDEHRTEQKRIDKNERI